MMNLNYWKQFESTGKVEDYLFYRTCSSGELKVHDPVKTEDTGQLGVNPYAGICTCNRNCIETDAYRGI